MAKVSKDFWGTTHVDVTEEVQRARRQERFQRDMNAVGSNLHGNMTGAAKGGAGGAAAMGLGVGAVGIAAAGNRSFRYKMQAALHFPFAILVSFGVLVMFSRQIIGSSADDKTLATTMLVCLALAVPIGIAWSMLYIAKRTKPKLRGLRR